VSGLTAGEALLLLVLELAGTFAFALNGALTAIRTARLDVVGVITLGVVTALGGGILRDILSGVLPPVTFRDWRFLVVAAIGGLVAFFFGRRLDRLASPINLADAAGLSLFAVTGAGQALAAGLGPLPAVVLGAVTAVGGGTIRDVLVGRVPVVLSSGLYAVPALVGSALTVAAAVGAVDGTLVALGAAAVCFGIRMVGVRYDLNAPLTPDVSEPR
jgi:uncharacterized membrane protein YeiH